MRHKNWLKGGGVARLASHWEEKLWTEAQWGLHGQHAAGGPVPAVVADRRVSTIRIRSRLTTGL